MSDDQKIDHGAILREMARIGLGQGGDTTFSFLDVALACEAVLNENERLRAALQKIRTGDWGPDESLEDLMREALDE